MGSISQADYLILKARLDKQTASPAVYEGCSQERKLHEQILNHCRFKRWLTIHSRMDCPTTNAQGVCDFIILADHSRLFLIECKTKTGKLSIQQMAFGMMADHLGHKVHVIRSFSEFLEIIQ